MCWIEIRHQSPVLMNILGEFFFNSIKNDRISDTNANMQFIDGIGITNNYTTEADRPLMSIIDNIEYIDGQTEYFQFPRVCNTIRKYVLNNGSVLVLVAL